jgi:hypothetical protein
MSRKIIFVLILSIIFSACAPTPMQTSEVSETSDVLPATATAEVTITPKVTVTVGEDGTISVDGIVTHTATPAGTATPPEGQAESLLPPDFTVKNWQEFRTAILPYCYVNPNYSDTQRGVENFYNDIKDSAFWEGLWAKFNSGEIYGFGPAVAQFGEDGGCGIVEINDQPGKSAFYVSGGFFQSRLNPEEWIEVKFTEPSDDLMH